MYFLYRHVFCDSKLTSQPQRLRKDAEDPDRLHLCANELAIGFPAIRDVSGLPSSPRALLCGFDNYLRLAQDLQKRAKERGEDDPLVWLVVPDDAGFSTYATLYLWRRSVEAGSRVRDWSGHQDWSSHHLAHIRGENEPDYERARFEYLLAAYVEAEKARAAIPCPLHLRLRSVFLAACRRRAGFLEEGAHEFFEAAQQAIASGRNPFYDCLFAGQGEYGPELELLARDAGAYQRDIKRATCPSAAFPRPESDEYRCFEVAWIEEPESILFPDRAWRDHHNSEEHEGFAVVRCSKGGRAIFAIDPQITAQQNPNGDPNPKAVDCSSLERALNECDGYRGRDNWQRASDYLADSREGWWSLREPERRTSGEQDREKAQQDALERICEEGIFAPNADVKIIEWAKPKAAKQDSSSSSHGDHRVELVRQERTCKLSCLPLLPPDEGTYRFASIELRPLASEAGKQFRKPAVRIMGETLWKAIRYDTRKGVPHDFVEKHRQGATGLISVWSRYGMAIAFNPDIPGVGDLKGRLEELLLKLVRTTERFKERLENRATASGTPKESGDSPGFLEQQLRNMWANLNGLRATKQAREPKPGAHSNSAENQDYEDVKILGDFAELRLEMSKPEGRLLRRLFDQTQQAETHAALLGQKNSSAQCDALREIRDVQSHVEDLEIFVLAFYTAEFASIVMEHLFFEDWLKTFLVIVIFSLGGIFLLFWLWSRHSLSRGWRKFSRNLFFVLLLLVLGGGGWLAWSGRGHVSRERELSEPVQELKQSVQSLQEAVTSLRESVQSLKAPPPQQTTPPKSLSPSRESVQSPETSPQQRSGPVVKPKGSQRTTSHKP